MMIEMALIDDLLIMMMMMMNDQMTSTMIVLNWFELKLKSSTMVMIWRIFSMPSFVVCKFDDSFVLDFWFDELRYGLRKTFSFLQGKRKSEWVSNGEFSILKNENKTKKTVAVEW